MIINPAIWVLIIPSILFVMYLSLKHSKIAIFALCWFTATYIIWIPINIITDRLTYDYYFYPAVGAVCIGISLGLSQISNFNLKNLNLRKYLRLIVPVYLGISLWIFISLYLSSIWLKISWSIMLFTILWYYLDKIEADERIADNSLLVKNITSEARN